MTCGNARRQSRWLRFTSPNGRQRGKSAVLSAISDVSGPQNQPVFVSGAKMKLRARGFEIVCEFVPGLVPNAYARTRGVIRRQGGQNDNQTRPNQNGATTNERERVGITVTGFWARVLVPPSTAWCCFGAAIEQSHQRNNGNNGLRTLWFGGFLFALLPE